MNNLFEKTFENYLGSVITGFQPIYCKSILLTHVLSNQVQYFHAFFKIAPVELIIAIPYSLDQKTFLELSKHYHIITPTLEELLDSNYLKKILLEKTKSDSIIIQEIGGYFAKALCQLPQENINRVLGVIEDTEAGHRIYEHLESVPCPVFSVARSPLKSPEDALVGGSCLFSTEKILRELGLRIEGKKAFVLGFGKIGRGLAYALQRRSCLVSVYDTNPIKRIQALSEGFNIPEKVLGLGENDLIFGATGNYSIKVNDFSSIKNGAMLVSCSSKDIEFDLKSLKRLYSHEKTAQHVELFKSKDNNFYLFGSGLPINFIDQSSIGPVLTLCQAEMLLAAKKLLTEPRNIALSHLGDDDRKFLAEAWIESFCNNERKE